MPRSLLWIVVNFPTSAASGQKPDLLMSMGQLVFLL